MDMEIIIEIITKRYENLMIYATTQQKKDEFLMERNKIITFLKQQKNKVKILKKGLVHLIDNY